MKGVGSNSVKEWCWIEFCQWMMLDWILSMNDAGLNSVNEWCWIEFCQWMMLDWILSMNDAGLNSVNEWCWIEFCQWMMLDWILSMNNAGSWSVFQSFQCIPGIVSLCISKNSMNCQLIRWHMLWSYFNSLSPSDAYMRHQTKVSLVQIMAHQLIGTEPLSESSTGVRRYFDTIPPYILTPGSIYPTQCWIWNWNLNVIFPVANVTNPLILSNNQFKLATWLPLGDFFCGL